MGKGSNLNLFLNKSEQSYTVTALNSPGQEVAVLDLYFIQLLELVDAVAVVLLLLLT